MRADGTLDPQAEHSATKLLWNQTLELTWNHGTEADEGFKAA